MVKEATCGILWDLILSCSVCCRRLYLLTIAWNGCLTLSKYSFIWLIFGNKQEYFEKYIDFGAIQSPKTEFLPKFLPIST